MAILNKCTSKMLGIPKRFSEIPELCQINELLAVS